MSFWEWLAEGRAQGWVVGEFCGAHDVVPRSAGELAELELAAAVGAEAEQALEDEMLDRCAPCVRLEVPGGGVFPSDMS